jgi:hypothetical protein
MKFTVLFYFGKEDYNSAIIEANSKEELKKEILETKGWYEYKNEDLGADYAIQMNRVDSISISEYQDLNTHFVSF